MRILRASSAANLPIESDAWQKLEVNATRQDVTQKGYVHDVYEGSLGGGLDRAIDDLLHYKIFPPHRMRSRVCTDDGRVAVGATIVQRMFIGPVALETAVRVVELERSPDAALFGYATMVGHPERGIATFEVRRDGGELKFVAQARSRAGNLLALVGRPVSRYLQKAFTREAVSYFCANSGRVG